MADTKQSSDLFMTIANKRPEMSSKLASIADFSLEKPEQFIRNSSREICGVLKISEPTLIKFCQLFGYGGLSAFRIDLALSLAHPGRSSQLIEPLANDRRQVNFEAKLRIARRAVGLVENDTSLLIDNGSTAEAFAMSLDNLSPKTIMTTGMWVAQKALEHGQHTVMMTGGRVRPNAMAMTGRMVETSIKQMHFDTFVMGADSVDPDKGLSAFHEDEAHNTRCMVDAASRVIVLADRTKILKPSLHKICEMDRVHTLVTDLAFNDPLYLTFIDKGINVVTTADTNEIIDEVA